MTISEYEVATTKMPGYGVIPSTRLAERVLGFLAKEKRVRWARHSVTTKNVVSDSTLMCAHVYCVHKKWI